jgi:hypothetical protein
VGRFGDYQEGIQESTFKTRSGYFRDFNSNSGTRLSNIAIQGTDKPITIRSTVNDYCSCSSLGKFKIERARNLQEKGNPEIGAFVTYDLRKLKLALEHCSARNWKTKNHVTIGREIEYGDKDRHWQIEETFDHARQRSAFAIWLGATFVKSPAYEHEEEFRLLLLDAQKPEHLKASDPLEFRHGSIASSIVAVGEF